MFGHPQMLKVITFTNKKKKKQRKRPILYNKALKKTKTKEKPKT